MVVNLFNISSGGVLDLQNQWIKGTRGPLNSDKCIHMGKPNPK